MNEAVSAMHFGVREWKIPQSVPKNRMSALGHTLGMTWHKAIKFL